MPKRSSKKRLDLNQLAARIVAESTGQAEKTLPPDSNKNQAAVALGRLGGLKGGPARAKRLSAKQRSRLAARAAKARWGEKSREK